MRENLLKFLRANAFGLAILACAALFAAAGCKSMIGGDDAKVPAIG